MANKVLFDPITKIIEVTEAPVSGTVSIDFKIDVYSDGKEDWVTNPTLNKIKFPIRSVGGDSISDTKGLGATFFLLYGWQIRPYSADHKLLINGNIYTDPAGGNVFLPASGSYSVTIETTVSNLSDSSIAQLPQIEYASFNNGVSVDVSSSYSGIVFPVGTPAQPVNNFPDALLIAAYRGFDTMFIESSHTELDTYDLSNFVFIGNSSTKSFLYVQSGSDVQDCEFYGFSLSGCLDGATTIQDCSIYDLHNFNGLVKDSLLEPGTLYITGSGYTTTHFLNCWSGVPGSSTPTIDMGGSGSALSVRNYNGGIQIQNKTGPEAISLDINSGQVKLMNTITNGEIVIRGVGQLSVNQATGSSTVNTNGLMAKDTISDAVLNTSLVSYTDQNTVASALRFAEYGNVVSVQATSPYSGSEYPVGTLETPVNNIQDAETIADNTGIEIIHIHDNYTFTSSVSISDQIITGDGKQKSVFYFDPGSILGNCIFREAQLTGSILGPIGFTDCYINGFEGSDLIAASQSVVFQDCLLQGTLKIPSNYSGDMIILDSWMLPTNNQPPIINMSDAAFSFQIRNLSGFMNIQSCSQATNDIRIFLNQGGVRLDPSVTAGKFTFTGVGTLVDSSSAYTSLDTAALINQTTIADGVWDEPIISHVVPDTTGYEALIKAYDGKVHLHEGGSSGQTYPYGTLGTPVGSMVDALVISSLYDLSHIHVMGTINIDSGENLDGKTILADRSLNNRVNINSASTEATYFTDLTVSGTMDGSVRYTTCVLGSIGNYDGGAKNCLITDEITITGNGANYFTDCDSYVTDASYKKISVGDNLLNIIRGRGSFEIADYTGTNALALDFAAGTILIASSSVSGTIVVSGLTRIVDESGPGCLVINAGITETGIADKVWDEQLSGHLDSGSAGYALSNVSASSGATPAAIASAVWGESTSSYTTPGIFGSTISGNTTDLKLILGLVQHNFRMTNQVYDASGNMTSAEINIYPSSADATAETNSINTYYITAVYDGSNRLTDYKMVE